MYMSCIILLLLSIKLFCVKEFNVSNVENELLLNIISYYLTYLKNKFLCYIIRLNNSSIVK